MSYKLIACDLDETLLTSRHTVGLKDRQTIINVQKAGVKFVCATGRGFTTVYQTQKELGQYNKAGCYTIGFNGGTLTENRDNRLLYYQGLSYETASALFNYGLQFDVCLHAYTKDTVYICRPKEYELQCLQGRMGYTIIGDSIDFLKDQPIVKVLYMNQSYDYLQAIHKKMGTMTADLDVSYSSNRYLEFNHKGVNKGAGLIQLARLLDIDISQTIAIGDNINDLPMIQAAGLGVGVANTLTQMKDQCDYLCQADCEHDPVSEVIERFILNRQ